MNQLESKNLIERHIDGNSLLIRLKGNWILRHEMWKEFDMELPKNVSTISFFSDDLESWDSSLLTYLLRWHDLSKEKAIEFKTEGLSSQLQKIIEIARSVTRKHDQKPVPKYTSLFYQVGVTSHSIIMSIFSFTCFLGECLMSLLRFVTGRSQMRWDDFWDALHNAGGRAIPIIVLINFMVGLIIAFLGSVVLARFGANIYVSYLIGFGILREMSSIITGVVMAGRTGAAFAAQIGSMKASEELDALETSGISVMDFVVLPRLLSLIITIPLLTVLANVVGIMGGVLVALSIMDISMEQFLDRMRSAIQLSDFLLGIVKALIFGIIVSLSGCLRGLQSGRSADAVGLAATSAVVTSITFIIVANAIIDCLCSVFGI